jgi:hypothetical protein
LTEVMTIKKVLFDTNPDAKAKRYCEDPFEVRCEGTVTALQACGPFGGSVDLRCVFLVESQVAHDSALVAHIHDLRDRTIQGDLGRGRSLAQSGHQSRGYERRQRQLLGELAEQSFDLVSIVDQWRVPDSRFPNHIYQSSSCQTASASCTGLSPRSSASQRSTV